MQATLLTLAIAAILALLAALLGPHFVDWNAHRATFEQQASQAIGLPVRVSGPMDVRLLPSPTLVLSGVEIGKPGDAQTLRAKALGIEFALPPLLSGKFQAVELRLIAPEMKVSLASDGRALLPNALVGLNTQPLSIDKLVVEDARLELADAASGTSASLSKLWFNGDVRALPGPIRGEGAFVMDGALYGYRVATARPEANGTRIKISLDPSDRPVLAEAEGVVTAEAGIPKFEGIATIARRMPPKGDMYTPWRISARVKANAASALFEQVEYQYGPEDRALKLSGTAEAKFGARPRLDAVLSARTFDADKLLGPATGGANQTPRAAFAALITAMERVIGPPIPTQLGFGIDAVTLGGASLQNIRGDLEFGRGVVTVTAFEARGPGFTQLQASGRLEKPDGRLSFAGPVDATSGDPRTFADWLEGKPGASPLPSRPLRFRGDVRLGADRFAIARMQADFDRKAFEGDVAYSFGKGAERPRLDATLRADELDLDALLGAADQLKAVADIERPQDMSLALSLKRLRFAGLDADGTDMRLSLNAGALAIETFTIADLAGIAIDGKGRVDTQSQGGDISFSLALRDPKQLSALAKRAPPFLVEPLERAALAAAPAKLVGNVTVEPAGRSGDGRANIELEGPLGAIQFKLKSALSGRWNAPGDADIALEGSLDSGDVNALLKLAAAERSIAVPRQPGTYSLALKGRFSGDMTIDTRIVSANLDARASGTMRPFASDVRRAALDIAIGSAEIVLPGTAAKPVPVVLKTRLVSDALGLRLDDLSGNVAGSALRGRLALAYGDMSTIDGELRTDRIDAAALFAAVAGTAPAAKTDRRWSETPFVLPALPKLAGQLNVSAAQATLSLALQVSKFRSVLRFDGGNVTLDEVEGELLGGRLSSEVTIRRGTDGLGLQGRVAVTDVDATQLLFGDGAAPLTGQAALTLQFEGFGRSPRALVGSLNGSGKLILDRARVTALDPKVFAAAMQSADQGLPIDAPRVRALAGRALDAGPLVVPHAEAMLSIAGGVARIDTFTSSAEAADLAVTGAYDFSDQRIDLRLAMAGPASGAPLKPEIAVLLRGPAAAPERVLDVAALTGWLALRSVDRHTKKIEAIEQGRPAEAAAPTQREAPQSEPAPQREPAPPQLESATTPSQLDTAPKPDVPTAVPQRRQLQQPAVQPLPPPIEIKPSVGERRRTLPQQRAEPQRVEPRPGSANPFPHPIGSPQSAPVLRPVPPQPVRPIF